MKLQQLQEAKYYRTPSREQIYDILIDTMNNSRGDVQVLDVEMNPRLQSVYADVRIWVYTKHEAEQAIDKFLKKHNLPQVGHGDLNEVHRGDWRAVIIFGNWDDSIS